MACKGVETAISINIGINQFLSMTSHNRVACVYTKQGGILTNWQGMISFLPARLTLTVMMSPLYIARGSSTTSPIFRAAVGATGLRMASKWLSVWSSCFCISPRTYRMRDVVGRALLDRNMKTILTTLLLCFRLAQLMRYVLHFHQLFIIKALYRQAYFWIASKHSVFRLTSEDY